jgi:integrase
LTVGRHGDISYRQGWRGKWTAETYVRDQDGTRRRVRATGTTRTAARHALDNKLDQRRRFTDDGISSDTTVADLTARWLDERATQGIAPQTLDRYHGLLDVHIRPGIGNLRLNEATTGRIDRFLKATAAGTPTQARHCRTVLSGAFAMAVRHDALGTNPIRETATVPKKPTEPRALTAADVAGLRRVVARWQAGQDPATGEARPAGGRPHSTDLAHILDILLATGARIGEVLALRWSDIDLDGADGKVTATISGTLVSQKAKGLIRQDHPKTQAGWRTITLPAFAADTLRQVRATWLANPHDVVFPSHAGTLRSPNNVRRQLRDAIGATDYAWVAPHSFRRTVATVLDRERTADDAAAQLGHSDPAVTKTHYIQKAHQAPDVSDVLQRFGRPTAPVAAGPEALGP